ncbi:MAG TPA: hydantoinase/oxoprolinase family protein [Novosphingobium sp.]|nr:hydantoinase/oxoprolinase family protein [Novosphingobium sp.]
MSWFVGIDVGGTFTDFTARNSESGRACVHKRPSTPGNPAEAILAGLDELCAAQGIAPAEISRLSHGTTVATNALIQHRGGKLALIVTKGFRDLLEIGRQVRPLIYDFQADHPPALVPRPRRFEAAERITRDGEVIAPLDEGEIDRLVAQVRAAEVDAVAVCLLFAFVNDGHERRLGAALRKALPGVHVSLSSEVQSEFREYERLSTSVLNAYLQPVMARYLTDLEAGLAERAPECRLGVNQSSGGLISVERARQFPIRTALSGPAAGISGALDIARRAGVPDVITLDMGGTSADVALIRDYAADMTRDRWVEGYPVRLSAIDIHAVGAGGGSIAWRDADGLLKVGPQSAGAVPGPACYRRGGTLPTVSDANLVLGRLPAGGLLKGSMAMDVAAARQVIGALAAEIDLPAQATALGIIEIVVANMARAVRKISVERGFDPRDFTLMPFGGAGPLHGVAVARALGIRRLLIPPHPGLLCAQGLLASDDRENFVAPMPMPLGDARLPDALDRAVASLHARAERWFAEEEVLAHRRATDVLLDLRYVGQNFELSVPLALAPGEMPDRAAIAAAFHSAHERTYGFHNGAAPIEVVCMRLVATARLPHAAMAGEVPQPNPALAVGEREVVFAREGSVIAPVYAREALHPGDWFTGPAIVDQLDTTILLHPGDRVRVDATHNLLIEVGK